MISTSVDMSEPATLPSVRGTTNRPLPSRELRVVFREVTDLSPADYASETLEGHDRHQFVVSAIRKDDSADREKWLYVFAADVRDADLTVLGTSLKIEGQYDRDGALRLVDWSRGAGAHGGLDRRPLSGAVVPEGVLTLVVPARRAQGGAPTEGVRTVLLAFLSHVPLPAHRLDRYFSNDPDIRLPDRALLIDPTATSDEGAFGSTMATGRASSGGATRWVRPTGDGVHTEAFLVDSVDFAFTLHERYQAAANLFDAFTIRNATRMFHADMTRSVASGYMAQQGFEEEGETEDDVPGQVFTAIEEYKRSVEVEHAKVEFWAHHLHEYWMEGTAFELAREDASDYGPLSTLNEPRRAMIDAEVARQGELLQGAERSDRGRRYLAAHLAQADAKSWYERVALASQVTARLADVPKIYLTALREKAADEVKAIASDTATLHQRRLAAAGDYLSALEYARAIVPAASGRIDALQLRLLDPMDAALRTGEAPARHVDAAAEAARRRAREVRDGRGVGVLERAVRSGAGIDALPVSVLIAPDGLPLSSPTRTSQAGLILTDHSAVASDSRLILGPEPIVTFGSPRTESGLIVLQGPNGSEALADLRPLLGGGPLPAPDPVAPATPRRSALSRLLDATGRPLDESPGQRLQQIRDALAARQGQLDEAVLREQLRTRRVNWAGRLFMALNFLDLVAGVADTRAKMETAERDVGRGRARWEAYLGAMGAGIGSAAALAGLAESAESIIPARLLSATAGTGGAAAVSLSTVLKAAGIAGAVFGTVAGTVQLRTELGSHDAMGAVSAGFAIAAGLAGLAAAISWIPFGGWVAGGVILGLAGVSAVFGMMSDTPIEEWLRNCIWSQDEAGEVEGLAPDAPRVSYEIEDLLALLAAPRVSVELRYMSGGEVSRLMRYHTASAGTPARPPDRVRLVVWPGLQPPGSLIEITAFTFLHPFTFANALEDLLPFSEGERTETAAPIGGVSPRPDVDLVVLSAERGPSFVREYSGSVLPAALRGGDPPFGTGYSCRATVRLPAALRTVANPVFELAGSVGFVRDYSTSDRARPMLSVVDSVSTSEPAARR